MNLRSSMGLRGGVMALAVGCAASGPSAQGAAQADAAQNAPAMATCNEPDKAPFCQAVRGDRAAGWLSQGRSEVMARHGMVVTSQPLAAQVGLQILKQGGNAVDAAVATAAALNLMEPMMVAWVATCSPSSTWRRSTSSMC